MFIKNCFRGQVKKRLFKEPLKTQKQTSYESFLDSLGWKDEQGLFWFTSALFKILGLGHLGQCSNTGMSLQVRNPASGVSLLGVDSFLLTSDFALNHEDESCFLSFLSKVFLSWLF